MTVTTLAPFYDMPYTNKDGSLTAHSQTYNDQLFQTLNQMVVLINKYISDNGITFPNKTTVEITALEPDAKLGTVWFNTNLAKLQVKTANGTIETITST